MLGLAYEARLCVFRQPAASIETLVEFNNFFLVFSSVPQKKINPFVSFQHIVNSILFNMISPTQIITRASGSMQT